MSEEVGWLASVSALLATGLLGAWTAWACLRAKRRGLPGSDALVWAALAAVYIGFSQIRLARRLGAFAGMGDWLRTLAKQNDLYANRRSFQVAASVAVALVALLLLLYGLFWAFDYIKRYRLAIGFASLAVGFAVIRFISLHEVDAWNAEMPWLRPFVELLAAAGGSAIALTRLWQLGELGGHSRSALRMPYVKGRRSDGTPEA